MQIHHVQTGTVRVKQFQLTGASNIISRFYQLAFTEKWGEWMPIYSWLIELEGQLILVDTGETADIYQEGYLPKGGLFHKAAQTRIASEEEIQHQLQALGHQTDDISTIILTHLHGDHIGGIAQFPKARFIAPQVEYELATSKKGPGSGYFAKNWPTWFEPELIAYTDRAEGNFEQSYPLDDTGQVVIVPTPGHSVGHQSVIVKDGDTNYFIGGDLTYNTETLIAEIPNMILANKAAHHSVKQAHQYVKAHQSIFLSAHDWNVPDIIKESRTIS